MKSSSLTNFTVCTLIALLCPSAAIASLQLSSNGMNDALFVDVANSSMQLSIEKLLEPVENTDSKDGAALDVDQINHAGAYHSQRQKTRHGLDKTLILGGPEAFAM